MNTAGEAREKMRDHLQALADDFWDEHCHGEAASVDFRVGYYVGAKRFTAALESRLARAEALAGLATQHIDYLHLQLKNDPNFSLSVWERAWLRKAAALTASESGEVNDYD